MNERERMMQAVYTNGFAADDARLFLDTHPQSREALDYYKKKIRLYQEARARYEEKFGPISVENAAIGDRWGWGEEAWPWEGGK